MAKLSKLVEIEDLRTVWPHEANDFTPWLSQEENMALLSDAIGVDISVDESESSVGSFNVDIYAHETGTEKKIVIENQLEDTNHDHLGKLITYASGKDANIVVWIVKRARDEHKSAIEWLNNHTDDEIGFFLCEIKLFKIGDSLPAVKFEVIEKPNDWTKSQRTESYTNENEKFRYDYWVAFEDYAFSKTDFGNHFNRRKPSCFHWLSFYIGSASCHLSISQLITRNELDIELNIDDDKDLFHELYSKKDEIEKIANMQFDWREMPERKSSRILIVKKNVKLKDQAQWQSQFDWIVSTMITMKKAFKKFLV